MTASLPLEGVRVLDLAVVWAGPYGAQILADWGAEVIRLEPLQMLQPLTRGLEARPSRPETHFSDPRFPDNEPGLRPWNRQNIFNSHARNKLSMTIDLLRPEGHVIFEKLLRVSDVIIENNPVSTLEKLGIVYDDLVSIKPDIILVRIPPYGLSGPYVHYRSVGSSLEAVIGHTSLRGYPDMDPSMTDEVYLADAVVGASAAFATASALCLRQATGKGQLVEVPQAETMVPYFGEALMDCTMNGRTQSTLGNGHPSKAPHGCYPCRGEDKWVVISVGSDAEWEALCRVMGNPTWSADPRYGTCLGRWNNQGQMDPLISEWTRGRDPRQAMALLQGEGIACGVVMGEEEFLNDPHLRQRGFLEELHHVDTGTYLYPGLMWKSAASPNHLRRPPCLLGEHNEYVYKEVLGVAEEEYRELEAQGHIGTEYPPHVK